ncbi:MAG: hypothetical protein JKY56_20690 [Kofleriaceae bacterium]|nr:hypothetical protein [Kofleriaceae bacterium]
MMLKCSLFTALLVLGCACDKPETKTNAEAKATATVSPDNTAAVAKSETVKHVPVVQYYALPG